MQIFKHLAWHGYIDTVQKLSTLTGLRLNDQETQNMALVSRILEDVRKLDSFEPLSRWLHGLRLNNVNDLLDILEKEHIIF
jgi:hypothetical protein